MQNNLPSNVSERSPDLLTRAIQEYWKDLAPTENEISFVSDLACYISDVTIGTSYLAPEVVEQRVQEFWNGINKLSFENISQLTTEDWIDGSAYIAARVTWAASITKTAAVLRNLKNVGAAASGAMASFADKFIKIFDGVIGGSPAVITAKGVVIVNASPVLVEEAARALYSLNGMQDTGGNKPEIIKDVDSVLSKEAAKKIAEAKEQVSQRSMDKAKRSDFSQKSTSKTGNLQKQVDQSKKITQISQNGKYKDAPYHSAKGNSVKSARPTNGQKALDNSVSYSERSPNRVGTSEGEIVILSQTSKGEFHGHVRTWAELLSEGEKSEGIRNALRNNGFVNKKGKILK